MGCDIHVMIEARKQPIGPDGWFNMDNWQHNPYFGDEGEPAMTVKPIYTRRSYELFSFLAGVRDYGVSIPQPSMPGGARMPTPPVMPPLPN